MLGWKSPTSRRFEVQIWCPVVFVVGDAHRWKTAVAVTLALIAIACKNPTDADPTAITQTVSRADTAVTVPFDSEWQIPTGFEVLVPYAREQFDAIMAKDVGPPPDLPVFSMTRASEPEKNGENVTIVVYSDGASPDAGPEEVLASWTRQSIAGAEYVDIVTVDRSGLQMATWRGRAQGPGQDSPQGIIAAVIYDLETYKVWRLLCAVSSNEVSDEVAQICEQVQREFRPL